MPNITPDILNQIADDLSKGKDENLTREYRNLRDFGMYAMRTFPIDPMIKEDLSQNVLINFVRLCQNKRHRHIPNLRAYLSRMFFNACLDHLRELKKEPLAEEYMQDKSVTSDERQEFYNPIHEQIIKYICVALEHLNRENVEAIIRVYGKRERQNRIARERGITAPGLHYQIHKALKELNRQLEKPLSEYNDVTRADLMLRALQIYISENELEIDLES